MLRWISTTTLFLLIWGVFSACSSSIFSRSSSTNAYHEDLSKYRTKYQYSEEAIVIKESPKTVKNEEKAVAATPAVKTSSVEKELNQALNTINQQNKTVRYMPGYRIQIYVGNIRAEADAAKAFVYRNYPEMSPYVTFSQPTYRVKIGDFMTKADAEQVLSSVKGQYPTSVIIADKIEIEKGLLQAIADR